MRTGSSDILSQGHNGRIRLDARLKKTRKSRTYRIDLEGLESSHAVGHDTSRLGGSGNVADQPVDRCRAMVRMRNENSPLVAVDPLDPQKIVSVWVNNDTPDITFTPFTQVFIEGDYSIDGGKDWTPF